MAYFTQWNISVKAHWPRHEVLPEECKITSFATGQCLCQNTKILLLKKKQWKQFFVENKD